MTSLNNNPEWQAHRPLPQRTQLWGILQVPGNQDWDRGWIKVYLQLWEEVLSQRSGDARPLSQGRQHCGRKSPWGVCRKWVTWHLGWQWQIWVFQVSYSIDIFLVGTLYWAGSITLHAVLTCLSRIPLGAFLGFFKILLNCHPGIPVWLTSRVVGLDGGCGTI